MSRGQEWTDATERAALDRLHQERASVAIYIRQSKTDKDKQGRIVGVSLDQQEADCRNLPLLAGLPVEVFRDEDKSGKESSKRSGYQRMLAAVRDGSVRAIVCYDQSRISRDVKDFYEFMSLCEQHGVLVFQVLGGLIRTDDEWSWGMRAFAASMHRKEVRKRVIASMRRKKEQGWAGGVTAVGYRRVICEHRAIDPKCQCPHNKLVIDNDWKQPVITVWELYGSGRFTGVEPLVRHLNDELRLPGPGPDGRWHIDSVKGMLKSPTYIGLTHIGRHNRA